jgi:hypothetical protein
MITDGRVRRAEARSRQIGPADDPDAFPIVPFYTSADEKDFVTAVWIAKALHRAAERERLGLPPPPSTVFLDVAERERHVAELRAVIDRVKGWSEEHSAAIAAGLAARRIKI